MLDAGKCSDIVASGHFIRLLAEVRGKVKGEEGKGKRNPFPPLTKVPFARGLLMLQGALDFRFWVLGMRRCNHLAANPTFCTAGF
jgi:hypothetical protein